jgi:hypothetical protein
MAKGDSIRLQGFLSDKINDYRRKYRLLFATAFLDCEASSNRATALLFNANLNGVLQHQLLAVALWNKSVSSCQAAILLAERGMVPETKILVRSAVEFLFFAGASLADPSVLDRMVIDDSHERNKMARGMLNVITHAAHRDALNTVINEYSSRPKGVSAFSAFDAAMAIGLESLYQHVYRGMSLDAAHATIQSTNSFFQTDEQEGVISPVFGPNDEGIDFCLGLIQVCLSTGIDRFESILTRKSPE